MSRRLFAASGLAGAIALVSSSAVAGGGQGAMSVSGSGVHYFSSALVHSEEATPTGMIRQSTETVRLDGDLVGIVLYHVTSEFDFAKGSLVNKGTNFFSGTVAGSEPVVLHDGASVFRVDLASGETVGEVRLSRSKDAPHKGTWYECDLAVVGTGLTAEGDATFDYSGECRRKGS